MRKFMCSTMSKMTVWNPGIDKHTPYKALGIQLVYVRGKKTGGNDTERK